MDCKILLIGFLFFYSCQSEYELPIPPTPLTESFELNFRDKGNLLFDNEMCEFDNGVNQSQSVFDRISSDPLDEGITARVLESTYKNIDENDLTLSEVRVDMIVEFAEGQEEFTQEYLTSVLSTEDSNENVKYLHPHFDLEICGEQYDNYGSFFAAGESLFAIDEDFKYKINEYKIYDGFELSNEFSCFFFRPVLFLDITFEGLLTQENSNRDGTLYLEKSRIKLLFEIR